MGAHRLYGLTRTVDATTAVLTTALAKTHTRIDLSADDAYVDTLVSAATAFVERVTGRVLMEQTWKGYLDAFPGADDWIEVPRFPVIAVSSIQYVDENGDTQTEASATYTADTDSQPARIYLAFEKTWSTIRNIRKAITVTWTAGYVTTSASPDTGAVPADLLHAVKLVIADLYENREARLDMQNYDNPTVRSMLEGYRDFVQ